MTSTRIRQTELEIKFGVNVVTPDWKSIGCEFEYMIFFGEFVVRVRHMDKCLLKKFRCN